MERKENVLAYERWKGREIRNKTMEAVWGVENETNYAGEVRRVGVEMEENHEEVNREEERKKQNK